MGGWLSDILGIGDSGTKAKAPSAGPTGSESYADWIQGYTKYTPERNAALASDAQANLAVSDKLAQGGIDLTNKYGAAYNQAMIDLERQLAPQTNALTLAQRQAEIDQANQLRAGLQGLEDPQATAIRNALGNQVQANLAAGSTLTPEMRREIEQSIRAGQSARGMTQGNAAVAAEAFGKGTAGQNLQNQRQQAASNFLQLQAQTAVDPLQFVTGRQNTRTTQTYTPQISQGSNVNQLAGGAMDINNQNTLQNQRLRYNVNAINQANKFNWTDLLPSN